MKKHSAKTRDGRGKLQDRKLTIGFDLGDRSSFYCILDESGDVILERKVSTTAKALAEAFAGMPRNRTAMEAGLHSPWVSRLLSGYGHEVIVANARNVRLIGESRRKDDRMDAHVLARSARIDPRLLSPIQHRSAQAQADLSLIRARAALVRARTVLINTARGLAKSNGERLRGRNSETVKSALGETLSPQLQAALTPLFSTVEAMTAKIHEYDQRIVKLGRSCYPEVAMLTQVHGVGPLIALTYILTLEDPHRFAKSRDAGCISARKAIRICDRCSSRAHTTSWGRLESTAISAVGVCNCLHAAPNSERNGLSWQWLASWLSCYIACW
jgi:transposase